MSIRINPKDRYLLELLRENARSSITDLAQQLGVSRSTAQKRLERLEVDGIIQGYTVKLSSEFLDQEIKAHVLITVRPRHTADIIEAMKALNGVRAVYSVSGPYDLIAEIAALSVTELDLIIDRIISISGVERTVSSVILSTRLKREA